MYSCQKILLFVKKFCCGNFAKILKGLLNICFGNICQKFHVMVTKRFWTAINAKKYVWVTIAKKPLCGNDCQTFSWQQLPKIWVMQNLLKNSGVATVAKILMVAKLPRWWLPIAKIWVWQNCQKFEVAKVPKNLTWQKSQKLLVATIAKNFWWQRLPKTFVGNNCQKPLVATIAKNFTVAKLPKNFDVATIATKNFVW